MTMRIYVGTYAKYNNGSIKGQWLDLEYYSDKEEFIDACKELHSDEEDPELMFQDWEGIPEGMVSESSIDPEVFELAQEDDDTIEMLEAFHYCFGSGTLEQAKSAYFGKYDSEKEFAEEFAIESGEIDEDHPMFSYIDWEHYWSGNLQHSFVFHEGFVFNRDW